MYKSAGELKRAVPLLDVGLNEDELLIVTQKLFLALSRYVVQFVGVSEVGTDVDDELNTIICDAPEASVITC